jgi:hypothetical protein
MCLTDFIDWRYIHSWLVFLIQLVNCCPHGRRNYTCVLLPLYLLSDLPPPPSQSKRTVYADSNDDVFDRLETVRFFRLFTSEGDMENTGRGNTEPRGLKARVLP